MASTGPREAVTTTQQGATDPEDVAWLRENTEPEHRHILDTLLAEVASLRAELERTADLLRQEHEVAHPRHRPGLSAECDVCAALRPNPEGETDG